MAGHNIRVLNINDIKTSSIELKKIRTAVEDFKSMAEKSVLRCIKIYDLNLRNVNILKQAALESGADLIISNEAKLMAETSSDVILTATLKQLNSIYYKLQSEERFNLPKIAEEIKEAVLNFDRSYDKVIIQGKEFDFSKKTYVMGILNITPDSFSDGGQYNEVDTAVDRALEMLEEGADIIDIGAESSRPGANEVSAEEELKRIIPIVEALLKRTEAVLSIDTYKAKVAEECLKLGAGIINDISGLNADEKMAEVIADYDAYCILMHMQGTPNTMQKNPQYNEIISDIIRELGNSIQKAEINGIKPEKIMLDPGIGFGKTQEHNLEIINNLKEFKTLGKPLLVGASRKSFIGKILGTEADNRLEGSIATAVISSLNGANMIRVHDVKETVRAIKVTDEIKSVTLRGE